MPIAGSQTSCEGVSLLAVDEARVAFQLCDRREIFDVASGSRESLDVRDLEYPIAATSNGLIVRSLDELRRVPY